MKSIVLIKTHRTLLYFQGLRINSTDSRTQITLVKDGSPSDVCGKVEEGDEIVQVNYQTVVSIS